MCVFVCVYSCVYPYARGRREGPPEAKKEGEPTGDDFVSVGLKSTMGFFGSMKRNKSKKMKDGSTRETTTKRRVEIDDDDAGEEGASGQLQRVVEEFPERMDSKETTPRGLSHHTHHVRKSLRAKTMELHGFAMSDSKRALVLGAVEELLDDYDEDAGSSSILMDELTIYRTTFRTLRRLLEMELAKKKSGVQTNHEVCISSVENALNLANALILQFHGSEASKDAVSLLDPVARGFVGQFYSNKESLSSTLLAQNMAELSLSMRTNSFPREESSGDLSGQLSGDSSEQFNSARVSIDLRRDDRIVSWSSFDVFKFAKDPKVNGYPLRTLAMQLFEHFRLFDSLPLKETRVSVFLKEIESLYKQVAYHNNVHATDVTQAMAYFIDSGLIEQLEPVHVFTLLLSTVVHDVGHPGFNNSFLVDSKSEAAERWNNSSVNENGHLFTTYELLEKHKVLKAFAPEEQSKITFWLRKIILHTDMEFHGELLQKMIKEVEMEVNELGDPRPIKEWNSVWIPLAFIVHCADISNPARPYELAFPWATMITDEFYIQGDRTRDLMMKVDSFLDRKLAKPGTTQNNQLGFIKFVVKPTLAILKAVLPSVDLLIEILNTNVRAYEEAVEPAKT